MNSQKLQTQNLVSETAKQDPSLFDKDQKLQNQEQTQLESNAIDVTELTQRVTRDDWETFPEDKLKSQDEEQYLQNHEQAHSELTPRETGDDWVIWIRDRVEQAHKDNSRTSRNNLCIYRVPHYLYENDKKSYFPQTVSLGPYHHGEEHLQAMECHKWRAVDMILQRHKQGIEIYINAVKKIEEEARACYEGSINLSSNKFTEMLVIDGCFVLELLAGAVSGFSELGYADNDPIFAIRGLVHSIKRDMLMLENQVPFFVLCRLAELQNRGLLVRRLAARFFDPLMPTTQSFANTCQSRNEACDASSLPSKHELHCLNVFRETLLLRKSVSTGNRCDTAGKLPMVADKRRQRMIHCVTELRDAGFKFRKRDTDDFWDIQFNDGYLEIPKLLIHDGTKSLFLNLIAFEQCHVHSSNDITSYIIFMDNLIDSAEDVHYLRRRGIIQHSLGNDSEVADMFNGLCHEVVFSTDDIYLSKLLDEVNRCYKQKYFRKWNAWTRTLKHKYFDNPWAYLSFSAAVILLFLTLSQTYFAAYAYFKPNS